MEEYRTCTNCGLPTGFPYLELVVNGGTTLAVLCLRCAERRGLVAVDSLGPAMLLDASEDELDSFVKHRVRFLSDPQGLLGEADVEQGGADERPS